MDDFLQMSQLGFTQHTSAPIMQHTLDIIGFNQG
jgi:hypothetical protein